MTIERSNDAWNGPRVLNDTGTLFLGFLTPSVINSEHSHLSVLTDYLYLPIQSWAPYQLLMSALTHKSLRR